MQERCGAARGKSSITKCALPAAAGPVLRVPMTVSVFVVPCVQPHKIRTPSFQNSEFSLYCHAPDGHRDGVSETKHLGHCLRDSSLLLRVTCLLLLHRFRHFIPSTFALTGSAQRLRAGFHGVIQTFSFQFTQHTARFNFLLHRVEFPVPAYQ